MFQVRMQLVNATVRHDRVAACVSGARNAFTDDMGLASGVQLIIKVDALRDT